MNSEASGSHPVQPVYRIRIVDKMTPTLPSVSCRNISTATGVLIRSELTAMTCRNTPRILCEWAWKWPW